VLNRLLLALSCLPLILAACGPKLPPRYVIEKDVGPFQYRRYQRVLDIELPIAGNPAVGHTATYVRSGSTLALAPAFVTVYQHAKGLSETVRARLRAMTSYTFDLQAVSGEHLFRLRGDSGDAWLLWVSGPHLIKLGVPEGETRVPEAIVEAYLDLYPSDLDEKGHAHEGAASAGAAQQEGTGEARENGSQKAR
jgi:hypothetical protein